MLGKAKPKENSQKWSSHDYIIHNTNPYINTVCVCVGDNQREISADKLPKCQKENRSERSASAEPSSAVFPTYLGEKRKFKNSTQGKAAGHGRGNNGKRIYFATSENNENNANTSGSGSNDGGTSCCLASKNIFIDIFALFKCRIFYLSALPHTLYPCHQSWDIFSIKLNS